MRITIFLIGLLFFGCKTQQFNTDYTINNSDITIVENCDMIDMYISKITGKPLNGVYKIISERRLYSISIFKKGVLISEESYLKNKLWYKRKQLNSDNSIFLNEFSPLMKLSMS